MFFDRFAQEHEDENETTKTEQFGKKLKGILMPELLDVLRTEQKYILNSLERAYLEFILSSALHRDMYSGGQGYLVRSLYFDTFDDADFHDKIDGLEMRRKIRLRVYAPDASTTKLELKEKQGSAQRKRSLRLTREQAQRLCAGEYEVLAQQGSEFAMELYTRMQQFGYRPKCIVEYDRMAFMVPENDTRITLDSSLRMNANRLDLFAPDLSFVPVGLPTDTTMEVKFNGFLLSYVKDLISLSSRMRCSNSKYCAARNLTLRNDP